MKKVFLFLTMLLFAFVGTMRADVVEIGSLDGAANNSYLPMNSLYEYSFSEQIYTAEEIGMAGTINSITMWLYGNENLYTMPFDIYMVEVDKDAFESTSDWVTVTAADVVYSGEVTVHNTDAEAFEFVLDTPFNYSGNGNLVIAFNNNTGSWKSGLNGKVFGATGDAVRAIYARRDGTPYDIANLPAATSTTYQRNVVTLDMTAGGGGGELVEVTIGDPTSTTVNSYLPTYSLYEKSLTQQIYTADEIGVAGTINTLTMWLKNTSSYARNLNVYMKETDAAAFESNSAWVSMTEDDMVATFSLENGIADPTETAIELTTPFAYSGNANLVICFQDVTGSWSGGAGSVVMTTTEYQALYAYRDGTTYDPSNPGVNGTRPQVKSVVKLAIMTGGGPTPPAADPTNITTIPEVIDLGYRPMGYWMEPYQFSFYNSGKQGTINSIMNGSDAFMTVDMELPAVIGKEDTLDAFISTGTAAVAGPITEQFAIDYTGTRSLKMFEMNAIAYEPEEGDVWELAQEVTVPFTGNAPAGIHKNYNIPNSVEGANDVIYKVTFENDVMLTANTEGANGVARLYTEDFNGQPGPMVDNFYQYSAGGGFPPTDTWFTYDYTGSNTFFGTSAGGGMIYGYRVPASIISQVSHCYLTTVEAAARESYPYNLYVMRGGETPADAELIYYQEMPEPATAMYFFDMDIETPFQVGAEDLWVMFYSESPYAAYCGKEAVDVENAKIWYTTNGTTWYSNTTYTPVIYLHLVYPEPDGGEDVVLNLADMSMASFNTKGSVKEAKGSVNMPQHSTAVAAQQERDGYPMLYNEFIPSGTYYLAVASTDAEFDVNITTEPAPVPEPVVVDNPIDGQHGVANGDVMSYTLGDYTREFQILLGTEFPPVNPLVDWTDELFQQLAFTTLQNNKIYFMQINERNSSGTTYGDIIGFTSQITPVSGFAAEATELYPGESAVFTWTANRSIKGYNLYMDGEKLNETLITGTTYSVDSLEYNMEAGYNFAMTAVYDEGESMPTEYINVKMTGNGIVSGTVYEQDSITPVPFVTVMLGGLDEFGAAQTFTFTTDEDGVYSGELFAGTYTAYGYKDGYQVGVGDQALVLFEEETEDVNIIMYEFYYPLGQIDAELVDDNVEVTWSWTPAELVVDFEDGEIPDMFNLPTTYPWAITTGHAHEGTYSIKSTCESIASATSEIEATVDVPYDAKMGFWVSVSSENNYDKFHFYIDGVEQGQALSGTVPYTYKEYTVAAGIHTYKWTYQKDSSVNSGDDCAYVDDITMYRKDEPLPPTPGVQTYAFEDGTMSGWTSIDADGDGYGWVGSGNPGQYHNAGVSLAGTGHDASQGYVISGSYSNSAGIALTPDNYLVSPTPISAQDGAAISFYACAQDASYAAEHFGVAVSTTTATAGAFTTIQEWTMTAKRSDVLTAEAAPGTARGTRAQGSWYQYTVDLSSYAGQDIYVAIRHFNCTDMFILNVDDISLGDGSVKGMERGNRSLTNFNLYRRNNNVEEPVAELIGIFNDTTFAYTDAEWSTLPFGVYQYGIQAQYEGNATPQNRDEVIIGEGATTNNYLPTYTYYNYSLTEQIYTATEVGGAGTINAISFFNTGADRTRTIAVYMATANKSVFADNYDWYDYAETDMVFSGEVTFVSNDWTTITLDTPFAYNGMGNLIIGVDDNTGSYQSAVAFKADAVNGMMTLRAYNDYTDYDPTTATTYSGTTMDVRNQIKLDITAGGGGSHDGLSEVIWSNEIEKDMYSVVTVNVALNNGQSSVGAEVELENDDNEYGGFINEEGTIELLVRKGTYSVEVELDGYTTIEDELVVNVDEIERSYVLNEIIAPVDGLYVSPTGYAMWEGNQPTPGPGPGPQPGEGEWYYYGDDVLSNSIGASGAFYWAVMFPAGSYEGNMVTKVATYATGYDAFTGSVTIYNDGTTAPATSVGTMNISVPATEGMYEIEFAEPVTIDPSKNLWVVMYNASSSTYVAGACNDAGTANARWVSLDGSDWMDLATAGISGYSWILRAYVAQGAKGEVTEVLVSNETPVNAGVLTMAPVENNRMALNYKVMLDGALVGETTDSYFQFDVTGMEEGSEHVAGVAPVYVTGMGEYSYYTWTYAGCDAYAGATEFTGVANNGDVTLTWTLNGSTPPTPPTPPTGGWTEDFESGMPTGWTTLDADGDGFNWNLASSTMGTGYGHNNSSDMIFSQSYDNNYGVLYPDNYLVTPQVTPTAGSTFSFYACAQDASYAAEHFGVAVSTTTATASAFAMVQEWTMSAKGAGVMAPGRDGQTRAQGTWREYSVDLSSYAGQAIYIAIRHFNCSDMFYLDVDDVTFTAATKKDNRAMWDLVTSFTGSSAGQQAVATDGNYIYTASWQTTPTGGHTFYQYTMDGTFVEGFEIAGATGIRDLTTDGEYFYGTSGGAQIFILDFTTRTLVGTINCSGLTSRHISYDPERDGFWSGNWSTLALYSRTGSLIQNGPAPSSAYGSAYYKDADNVEHLYLFCQPNSDCKVYDYNITTGTLGTSVVLDYTATAPGCTGIAGGSFIGAYNGMTCWFGNSQQDPNLIAIYELDGSAPTPPTPPTPAGDVVGVNVYRDGEFLMMAPVSGPYYDDNLAEGTYEYCIQVVYDDYGMSCPQCITVEVGAASCDPVTNLTAVLHTQNGSTGCLLSWDAPAGAVSYNLYQVEDGQVYTIAEGWTATSVFLSGFEEPGVYTFGVTAVYANCESELETVDFTWPDSVDESEIVSAIYPNPTSGDLHINATAMTQVSVYNAMGQMVYNQAVNADEMVINMGQFEAGVYMVRIDTENGSSVKRITVVK